MTTIHNLVLNWKYQIIPTIKIITKIPWQLSHGNNYFRWTTVLWLLFKNVSRRDICFNVTQADFVRSLKNTHTQFMIIDWHPDVLYRWPTYETWNLFQLSWRHILEFRIDRIRNHIPNKYNTRIITNTIFLSILKLIPRCSFTLILI